MNTQLLVAFFPGGIGLPELLIVGLIVLLLFGSRLPSTMRSLGRGMLEFKRGLSGEDDEPEKKEVQQKEPSET